MHIQGPFGCLRVFVLWNTHSKSCLAVILKSQRIVYDQWFARCEFWAVFGLLGQILAQNNQSRQLFSLITLSILKRDSLRIRKQLLFAKMVRLPPFLDQYIIVSCLYQEYWGVIGEYWILIVRIFLINCTLILKCCLNNHMLLVGPISHFPSVFSPNAGEWGKNADQNNFEYVHFLCSDIINHYTKWFSKIH